MPRLRPALFAPLLLLSLALPASAQHLPCTDGTAGGYPCRNVDLMALLPVPALDADFSQDTSSFTEVNDLWGWTDPETGREYALVGRSDGTAFVDVTEATAPLYLGSLPSHSRPSLWRDLKTYGNHVFIVSEARDHGLQVFDLAQLREVEDPPVTFSETAHYGRFGSAHNVVINEETGYAYAVGSGGQQDVPADYDDTGNKRCGPGLHIVDIRDPAQPAFAGCFTDDTAYRTAPGYTHDAQCVVYRGPDADYQGHEICIASNEKEISIVDVSEKQNPIEIAQQGYPDAVYVHQGWLTEDHRYFLQGDELDETDAPAIDRTRTIVWDLDDLDDPQVLGFYFHDVPSIDHNLYVRANLSFQANYTSGLRVLDLGEEGALDVDDISLVAYFDTYPATDAAVDPSSSGRLFDGAWSNYPFFESGNVIVSSIAEGLFVLQPTGPARLVASVTDAAARPETMTLKEIYPHPVHRRATIVLANDAAHPVTVELFDLLGRRVRTVHAGTLPGGTHHLTLHAAGLPAGLYVLRAQSGSASVTRRITIAR